MKMDIFEMILKVKDFEKGFLFNVDRCKWRCLKMVMEKVLCIVVFIDYGLWMFRCENVLKSICL